MCALKHKKEIYNFVAGKYVAGDVFNLVEDKEAKKIKTTLSKLKTKGGFNKKLNIYYFIGDSFIDYIDKGPPLITENALLILPEENVKTGRLTNCKRFIAKHNFQIKYVEDKLGTVLYFYYPEEPGPFMMLVNEIDA